MAEMPHRSFRLRPPSLHDLLHITAFVGLAAWLFCAFYALWPQVHRVDYDSEHALTVPAQLFADQSPVPGVLALGCCITAAVLVLTCHLARPASPKNRLLRVWIIAFVVALLFVSALEGLLWFLDLRYREPATVYSEDPLVLALNTSLILYPLGAAAFILFLTLRRNAFAYLAFALPIPFLARIVLSPAARGALRDWGGYGGLAYPRIAPACVAVGIVVGLCVALCYARKRMRGEPTETRDIVAVAAILSHALFAAYNLGFVFAFAYLISTLGYMKLQHRATIVLIIAFPALWIAMLIGGLARRWTSARATKLESSAKAPVS